MNHRFASILRLSLIVAIISVTFLKPQQTVAAAVPAGFSEYFIPGETTQLWNILLDNDPGPTDTTLHNVITISVSTNVTVYYDHWENTLGSAQYGTSANGAADETFTVLKGQTITFTSDVPVTGHATIGACTGGTVTIATTTTTNNCYDGRDRIYVAGGAVSVSQAFWPTTTGTVYANAWEIYPKKPYQSSYTIPVGEDLFAATTYADLQDVYVLVQATEDGTIVNVDNKNPAPGRVQANDIVNLTLNKGQVTQVYDVWTGTTVTANKSVQVQFIVGQYNLGYDSRSHTTVPTTLWDTKYYSPVPSNTTTATANTNLYIFNPTSSNLVINYQDGGGSGSFTIPANSTRSFRAMVGRYPAVASAVYLEAADGVTKFWAIGEYDTGASTRNWGFSLIPFSTLTAEYVLSWAPGTTDLSANGSPVFVTPTQNNTTIFVDYSNDGTTDATFTLNRLQVQKIRDLTDNNNTGMRIWGTSPFAITWGEDAEYAGAGNPYIDAGYAVLPLKSDWIDVVVNVTKTANPTSITAAVGQVSTFTVVVDGGLYGLDDIYVSDLLPANWAYVAGSTNITWPGGSSTANPTIVGSTISWGSAGSPIGDLGPSEKMTLVYQAQTTGVPANYSTNTATATGTFAGTTFSASGDTTVVATQPDLTVIKSNNLSGSALVGSSFNWELEVSNGSSSGAATFTTGQTILRDNLPAGPTYGTASVTNGSIAPTGTIACSVAANVLTCTASGGSVTLPTGASFTVAFPVTPVAAGTLTNPVTGAGNVCQVDPNTLVTESNEANNTCSNSVTVVAPSMSISKTAALLPGNTPLANGALVNPGSSIAYTITVNNTGGTIQNNISVNDVLPTGTTYVAQSTVATGSILNTLTYRDEFSNTAPPQYVGSNGTQSWTATPWVESGADAAGSQTAGTTAVNGGWLRFSGSAAVSRIARPVNLTGAVVATLTFDDNVNGTIDVGGDFFDVEVSSNGGGSWTTLPGGSFNGNITDGSKSYDITSYANANTQIRFSVTGFTDGTGGGAEYLEFDNVQIAYTTVTATTKDNVPAGANADLISGVPSTLVTGSDGFDLAPGGSMTVVYSVTVNNPTAVGLTSITNTASVSSDEQSQPLTSTITHTLPNGTISGQVRSDVDHDGTTGGIADVDDSGLVGVTITLYTDPNGDGDPADGVVVGTSVVSDASGNYSFANIPTGNYIVVETDPANYTSVMDKEGDTTAPGYNRIKVALTAGANDTGNNFLDVSSLGSISGFILTDTNNDNTGDTPVANVTLTLYTDPNGDGNPADGAPVTFDVDPGTPGTQAFVLSQAVTGSYTFANVPAGTYVIVETQPAGYLDVSQSDTTVDSPLNPADAAPTLNNIPVNLAAGETDSGNTFVEEQPVTISGFVLADTNNDNTGDVGIQNVTLTLYTDANGDGIVNGADAPVTFDVDSSTPGTQPFVISAANGSYTLANIPPTTYPYIVVETQPAGYLDVSQSDTIADSPVNPADAAPTTNRIPVNPMGGETDSGNTFVEEQSGTITIVDDSVPNDAQDFAYTVTGTGLTNFSLDDDADATLSNTRTFSNLAPGSFTVSQGAVAGWNLTNLVCVDPDSGSSVNLGTGLSTIDLDAGESITCTYTNTKPAAISGFVLADTNNDNTGDVGIGSVTLTLYTDANGDGLINGTDAPVTFDVDSGMAGIQAFVLSAVNGSYTMTGVPAGSYIVVESQPAGYLEVTQSDTTADDAGSPADAAVTLNRIPVNLASGETDSGNTFVDDQPVATIAVSPAAVDEDGATNLVYTITLDKAPAVNTTINLSTTGTATSGTDYSGAAASVVINAGSTTGTVTIDPTTDTTVEADETVILTITSGTGYTVGTTNSATGTITNDDIAATSLIGIAKRVVSSTEVTPGVYDITYELYIKNYGNTVLNNVQVTDDLSATFPGMALTVQTPTSTKFAVNASFNGKSNTNVLLNTGNSLAIGESGTVRIVVRVTPTSAGPFSNTAVASGQCPTCTTAVTDDSQDGTNPDPDNDKDPTNNKVQTPVNFGPNLFDPPFGLKVFDASGLPLLRWTMVWINNSNVVAVNAQVTDTIPVGTTYVPGSVVCTPASVNTTTTTCSYDAGTNSIIWSGNLGPDLGATDANSAANEIAITFDVTVNAGVKSVQNTATIDTDLNGINGFNDPGERRVASATSRWPASSGTTTSSGLPATGFAPNVVTDVQHQPADLRYSATDLILEIPSLGVKLPIVGVPKKSGSWDVSWLADQAGWLEGTAFPSWNGNSVLTSHVYKSNGLPGPFVNISKLKYGDQVIVHAYGQKYTFEVRTNAVVAPDDTSAFKHEEKSWLTLVTCKEYDQKANTYKKRVLVRAVLIKVEAE